jgi:hypothetical protein
VPDTGPCLQLRAHLPETLKFSDWVLMFSTETDGVSLTNLYRQVKDAGPLLIFVKDEAGYVCGDDDTMASFFCIRRPGLGIDHAFHQAPVPLCIKRRVSSHTHG